MAGDGTSFEIDIPVAGAGEINAAANALDSLASKLTSAAAASTQAAAAVKAGEVAYRQSEAAADRAAKALEKVNVAAEAHRSKMKAAMDAGDPAKFWQLAAAANKLSERQAEAATRAEATKVAMTNAAASLDSLRATADQVAASHDEVNRALAETKTRAAEAAAAITKADAEIIESTSNRMRVLMNAFNQEALAQKKEDAEIAASTANRIAVIANALNEETRLRMSAANEAEKSGRKLADTNKLATDGTGKVNEMAEAFGKLGGPVGLIGSKLFGAADGFKKLKGSMGSTALFAGAAVAIAAVAAAIVAVTAAAMAGIASILKWSIALADKNKDVEKQTTRLRSNIDKIFSGLKIDGVIAGLEKVADLFEENSSSANAIKTVFESLFQPLVDGIAAFIPKVIAGFIQFEIWVMKALIKIKPFGSTLMTIGKVVAYSFAVIGAAVAVAIGVLLVPFAILIGSVMACVAAVMLLWAGIQIAVQWFSALGSTISSGVSSAITSLRAEFEGLSDLSLVEIGTRIIEGLAQGIRNGGAAVLSAITGVVGGAIGSAKKLLGIASPSKVFAEIGMNTAEGMAGGVDGGAQQVQSSLETMVAPPEPEKAAAAPTASGGGGANFSGAQFIFQGVQGAEDAVSRFEELMLSIMEGKSLQSGSGSPA